MNFVCLFVRSFVHSLIKISKVNGVTITGGVNLTAGVNVRLRYEYVHSTGSAATALSWTIPGSSTAVVIDSSYFVHQVECGNTCVQGCCVADNVCLCDEGYGGSTCAVPVSICNNGVSSLTNGSVESQYYSGLDFTTSLFNRLDNSLNFNWQTSHPTNGYFSVLMQGYLKPNITGWYTITITMTNSNNLNIWIARQMIVSTATSTSTPIFLFANRAYDIQIIHTNINLGVLNIQWTTPGTTSVVGIPSNMKLSVGIIISVEVFGKVQLNAKLAQPLYSRSSMRTL